VFVSGSRVGVVGMEPQMDKTTLGIMGAITSLAAAGAVSATAAPANVEPVSQANSYAELLDPIPNAVERLAMVNSQVDRDGARLIEAQYYPDGQVAHHHHHHHNNYVAPRENYYGRPVYHRHYYRHYHRRPVVVYHQRHHHHHHHHNNY
jgi:hypothetical protein